MLAAREDKFYQLAHGDWMHSYVARRARRLQPGLLRSGRRLAMHLGIVGLRIIERCNCPFLSQCCSHTWMCLPSFNGGNFGKNPGLIVHYVL